MRERSNILEEVKIKEITAFEENGLKKTKMVFSDSKKDT